MDDRELYGHLIEIKEKLDNIHEEIQNITEEEQPEEEYTEEYDQEIPKPKTPKIRKKEDT